MSAVLRAAGITQGDYWAQCDEMRFGLWGQVRRRWGKRGVKIVQAVQIVFAWQYLVLAVDVIGCELRWNWVDRMNQEHLLPVFAGWGWDAVVWDRAPAHQGKRMGEAGFVRVFLPPYSPELNPPERVFQELRRQVEGRIYASLAAKRRAIDQILRALNADKTRLRQLIGWDWIRKAYENLPDPNTRSP